MTDEDLLACRLADDLDKAFPDFVSSNERTVYTIALRMIGDRERAIDLAADTFHNAYRALRRYDATRIEQLKLRSWVVTIIVNLCRNTSRASARRPIEVSIEASLSTPSTAETPEHALERSENRRELAESLVQLSELQRAAVVLHFVVGLSYEEVALVLSCPIGTAKSHASRGIVRLRELVAMTNGEGR